MNDQTVTDASFGIACAASDNTDQTGAGEESAAARPLIAIAATFTADPLLQPLRFWLETVELAAELAIAPYGQLLRELVDPQSLLSRNRLGCNVLLLRPEDWIRDRQQESQQGNVAHIRSVAEELTTAVARLRERSGAALFVFFCPASSGLAQPYAVTIAEVEQELLARFGRLPRTHCWTPVDVSRLYPHLEVADERTDRIAHIPYAHEYFVALAALLARGGVALFKPQPKVIAIDCDNTLWQGICAEDGAAGVQLTPAHLALQSTLVRQHDAGVLLCLCSKNNPDDVAAIFKSHPHMPLREEHLICSRVNWEAKSANLISLAQELRLGLDSFVLLDDSALECAEVQAHCPDVLTLQVPDTQQGIEHFVRHCWAFDRLAVSDEGRRRTAQYRENQARREAQRVATDVESFLASLQLEVRIGPMQAPHLERVAELIQRTNQFNLTSVRWRTSELEAFAQSGAMRILVVHVRDRFGDYGLVGAVFYRQAADALDVEAWVLSCRALGRGVEHRIVNELGRIARDVGLARVRLRFRRSPRNVPAAQFLQGSFSDFRIASIDAEEIYSVPAEFAATMGGAVAGVELEAGGDAQRALASNAPSARTSARWHETVLRLSNLADLVTAVGQHAAKDRRREGEYVAPRTRTEETLAIIWREALGLPRVGIEDDFFAVGGDSLLAVRVVARIESTLGLELPLHEFFEGPTVAQLAQRLATATASASIEAVGRDRRLPLSWSQQRLWFIDELEGGSTAYHIQLALRMQGELNRVALNASLQALVSRHEVLRTTFVKDDSGEPMLCVLPQGQFPLRTVDLRGTSDPDAVLQQSRKEALEPFDLTAGPLVRARLLQLTAEEHVLLITMHHIVSDGWSLGILTRELAALYAAYYAGTSDPLPPLPLQYADYAHWQRTQAASEQQREQIEYWHEHLRGAPALLELPTDRPRPPMQSYRGANVPLALSAELVVQLRQLSRQLNITLAMTLYAAWSVVLSRLSGQSDIVIGMPIANRRRTQLEGLIGFFVNTLAVRFRLDDDPTLLDLLQQVKRAMLGAYANQDAPFEQVVDKLRPTRSLSHSPIFQTMLVLQNPSADSLQLPGLRMTQEDMALHTAQFDLLLSLQESRQGLTGFLNYATDLFLPQTIQRWLGYFEAVLRALVSAPQSHVNRLRLLGASERQLIVEEFNATRATFAESATIHGLFEEQVRRTPHLPAVWYEGQALTYAELNARANQLARHLRCQGVGPDRLVGICAERSIEMVTGLLGILKAGGAYVPIDPDYPPERIAYMLEDAAPAVLLTQAHLRAKLPATGARVFALDADWEQVASQPGDDLTRETVAVSSRHLIYVIYTSGSTGRPKGAMNEHRAVVNRLQWMQHEYGLTPDDRVLQKTPFSFDVSAWEFFWTLMTGACLTLARPRGHQDPGYLRQLIEQTGVTTLHFVPSMLQVFLDEVRPGQCSSLRRVICSGEELPASLQRKFYESLPHAALANLYGPTEAAIDVTYWECRADAIGSRVPIGRPIWNVAMYVLDDHREPAPLGVAGEIYIGGAGVGRGYLNRDDLTAERFVTDPFNADPAARLYKTGDLGRWRSDGALEYLGRNDHQVKIRGLRIELGEIEARLLRNPRVKEAVVVAREDVAGDKRLVAYLVPAREPGHEPACSAEDLRAWLKAALPDYMVPSAFVMLERMPLSPNGKLERRALPAPDSDALARRPYRAPVGEVEDILAAVWQRLLAVERVGRHDNFFELGGHSLLIVQMMDRLRAFGLSADLRQVFESSTLAELAMVLRRGALETVHTPPNLIPSGCEHITPQMLPLVELEPQHIESIVAAVPGGVTNVQDAYPLAPLQEGILFHHLLSERAGGTYVVPTVLCVSSRKRLDELIAALQAVIDRHDVLRTAILWESLPQPVQVVYRRAPLPVEEVTLDPARDVREQVQDWVEPGRQTMDLRRAPLLHLRIASDPRGDDRWYVLMRLHHIIGDNTSQEMVIAEVIEHLRAGAATLLPPSVPYREHVAQTLAQRRADHSEAFFRAKLGDVDEPTAPFGLLDVHGDGTHTRESSAQLNSDLTQRARRQARQLGVSTATFFHAAWSLVVARTSGRDDVVFGTVLLGRMQGRAGAQRTLGMFINTLPLRLQLTALTARQLVERTQRELIELVSHEQASLAAAQKCSAVSGTAPLFTALLNFRHSVGGLQSRWADAEGLEVIAVHERTNYPIVLSLDDSEQGVLLTAQTDTRIDPQALVGYMQEAVSSLTRALESAPETTALLLPILPDRERELIVRQFNATSTQYPRDRVNHALFEDQVRRTPNALAAVYEGERLSYFELNARANRLAHFLRAQGVEAGQYVPLMMSRSLQMLIAQLAVLKCGAVYVPMDPELPVERRAFMVRDCGACRLVTADTPRDLDELGATLLDCSAAREQIEQQPSTNLEVPLCSEAPSYVMYTSGSTGVPKGVVVPHRAVNRLAINNGYVEIGADDCLVHYSNPAFDASTFEIWGALLSGARVLIVPQAIVLEGERFAQLLEREGATILYMSVGLFNQYTHAMAGVFRRLRCLMVGGDSLEPTAIRRVLQESPPRRLLNAYGPTECTTFATTHHIETAQESSGSIPIGRPMANAQIYILDRRGEVVPPGVVGELHIGGDGVACGYLNRPELTAERFIRDPFSAQPHARLYKTGDLARWRRDGAIDFLGRNDQQVKLRGFRVELGEVEARLVGHEQVKAACVIARHDGHAEKRLVAYVVPQTLASAPRVEELRSYLKARLPEYMVPSAFVLLERMPLSSSGKVDRRALPAPDLDAYARRDYQPPQGQVEEILAGVWQRILQVERVGRSDNFFELGGHSLLMVQMMEGLRRVGLSAEVRQVFQSPTLAELASALTSEAVEHYEVPPNLIPPGSAVIEPQMLPLVQLERAHIERIVQTVPGGAPNVEDIYPLAPLQEGILFHHLLDEGNGDTYVLPTVLELESRERVAELIAALQTVVDRHQVLRTAVLWEQLPRALQVVYRRAAMPVDEVAFEPERSVQAQIADWIRPQRQRLDIRHAPLLRLQIAPDPQSARWYVMLQLHHMTIDHVALEIVTSEVVAHMEGRAQRLPDSAPYRNHVAQSVAYARSHNAEAFFRSKLADVDEPTAPFGLLDVHGDGTEIEDAYQAVEPELAVRIRTQARRLGVSAATLFHAAWALVVAHSSRRDDIVFGSVLLGRLQVSAGAQRTLGMFINTLPLRLRLHGTTARSFVEQTQRELVELLGHEQASLASAQRCSGIAGATPLFSALLNYRHSVPNSGAEWASARGVGVIASQERTNYPVTLSVDDLGHGFTLKAQVDRRVPAQRVTGYLHTAMRSLVDALEQASQVPVLELCVVPEAELREHARFNATAAEYPRHALIHGLFEDQVRRTPDAVAVAYADQTLTYAQLNARANQLARRLRALGVRANDIVGICIERRPEMVVGLLGILKAGAGYLPLDPSYPRERLEYMLQDAEPRAVLTQRSLQDSISASARTQIVLLDETVGEIAAAEAADLPPGEREIASDDLLYLIYTSGSTGRPKGTAMPHRAMVNLIEWHRRSFQTNVSCRVLQFAALSFDVAFQETFSTLCTGGTLVLLDEWTRRDTPALLELLRRERIERLFVPPLMLQSLAECSGDGAEPSTLKDIITAGEQLRITPEIVRLFERLRQCRLHNHYGPTETHVVTALTLQGPAHSWPMLPSIGSPIANTQIHILDERRRPVLRGVAGEIYIAGANLAREYLHRPELTRERFVRDPFSEDPDARMYKTGDLAKWLADGTIEYLGRNDYQVKIRGYRIELGEIEARLMQHDAVKEAAVVAREDSPGQKRLVAYVTPRGATHASADDLYAYAKSVLPEHMVPSAFVPLSELPLTPSGKLNRRALPAPDLHAYAVREYVAPQGSLEQTLAEIWSEVLGLERVGRDDDFFELGGHSLLALKALFSTNHRLSATLRVADMYRNPTIRSLARHMNTGSAADEPVVLSREAVLGADILRRPGSPRVPSQAVLLTGATGFVGRFLLAELLTQTSATVHCLVRARSVQQAQARLRATLLRWELWRDEFAARIVAIAGDLRLPRLGLDDETFERLGSEVDSIYHCATSMNHLETYAMAKPANVAAVGDLLRLAVQGRPKLVNYISTLGVFNASAGEARRVVCESTPIDHELHRSSQGYTASKWVGEKLFLAAAERGIPCNVFRLGLAWADSAKGRFDEAQNVYQVLKSCLLSGYGIKDYRYPMPPTPVDYVARAIVFLANRYSGEGRVFHISSAQQAIDDLFERVGEVTESPLRLLPYYDWICAMRRLHEAGTSLPAVPLIEYAFSMNEETFRDYQLRARSAANIRFDFSRTHAELEHAGIIAPELTDALLKVCIDGMLAHDPELQGLPCAHPAVLERTRGIRAERVLR